MWRFVGERDAIADVHAEAVRPEEFTSVGVAHARFWSLRGSSIILVFRDQQKFEAGPLGIRIADVQCIAVAASGGIEALPLSSTPATESAWPPMPEQGEVSAKGGWLMSESKTQRELSSLARQSQAASTVRPWTPRHMTRLVHVLRRNIEIRIAPHADGGRALAFLVAGQWADEISAGCVGVFIKQIGRTSDGLGIDTLRFSANDAVNIECGFCGIAAEQTPTTINLVSGLAHGDEPAVERFQLALGGDEHAGEDESLDEKSWDHGMNP